MRLPDGSVLMHDAVHAYDPVKAREYYLRTRKLKGRKKGATPAPTGPQKGLKGPAPKLAPKAKAKPVDPAVIQKKREQIKKRITAIRKELADLNKRLKEKVAEAKEAEAKEKRGPTAAEKSEAARDSKKYREKNEQKIKNASKKAGGQEKTADKPQEDTVESLQADIAKVKGRLDTAVKKLSTIKFS